MTDDQELILYLIIGGPLIGFGAAAFFTMWLTQIREGESLFAATLVMLFYQSPFIAIFYFLHQGYQETGKAAPLLICLGWTIFLILNAASKPTKQ